MRYITGIHALNLICSLETTGDWHQSALAWKDITFRDTSDSVYADWGVELDRHIPKHDELYAAANHIRACLDLLEVGNFAVAQGMKEDFICNDKYTSLVFEKVELLRYCKHWDDIDKFMGREYKLQWLDYKSKKESKQLKEIDTYCGNAINSSLNNPTTIIPVSGVPSDVLMHNVQKQLELKLFEFLGKDKIRDLYDIIFLGLNYINQFDDATKFSLQNALAYKGLEYIDYIVRTQHDDFIDTKELKDNYLKLWELLSLA